MVNESEPKDRNGAPLGLSGEAQLREFNKMLDEKYKRTDEEKLLTIRPETLRKIFETRDQLVKRGIGILEIVRDKWWKRGDFVQTESGIALTYYFLSPEEAREAGGKWIRSSHPSSSVVVKIKAKFAVVP